MTNWLQGQYNSKSKENHILEDSINRHTNIETN
jgi:hypothetical protein